MSRVEFMYVNIDVMIGGQQPAEEEPEDDDDPTAKEKTENRLPDGEHAPSGGSLPEGLRLENDEECDGDNDNNFSFSSGSYLFSSMCNAPPDDRR
mmetsp:Transcript_19125/g.46192  ORF Transcript_19125/g.46192 Transcript_19125/m.46192 type:complete len:95 (+) Transcript_19125:1379-1663(+)